MVQRVLDNRAPSRRSARPGPRGTGKLGALQWVSGSVRLAAGGRDAGAVWLLVSRPGLALWPGSGTKRWRPIGSTRMLVNCLRPRLPRDAERARRGRSPLCADSTRWPAVDPVTSQNNTVTVLRFCREAGTATKATPHPLQNLASAGFSRPQPAQTPTPARLSPIRRDVAAEEPAPPPPPTALTSPAAVYLQAQPTPEPQILWPLPAVGTRTRPRTD
jgi:hypothetical protein